MIPLRDFAAPQLGPGQEFAGFRFAGTNNWDGLMGEFGLPSVPGVSGCYGDFPCNIDPTMEANFTSLFGIPFGAEVDYNYYPAGVSGGPGPFFDEVVFFPGNMTSGYTISSYLIYSGFTEGCYVGGVILMLGGSGARCTHRPRTSVDLDAHRRSARVSGREAAEAPRNLDLVDFFGERPRWWHASLRSRLRRFSFPNRLGADRRQTDDIVSRSDGTDSGPVADKTENGPTHASATLSVADLPSDRTARRVSLIRGVCVWQAATAGNHAQPCKAHRQQQHPAEVGPRRDIRELAGDEFEIA